MDVATCDIMTIVWLIVGVFVLLGLDVKPPYR